MFLSFDFILHQVQFDLVTAAFTLSELPGVKDREDAVLTLWRKTNSYLVGLNDVQDYTYLYCALYICQIGIVLYSFLVFYNTVSVLVLTVCF